MLNSKIVCLRNILYTSIVPSISWILIKNLFFINQRISKEIFNSDLNLNENWTLKVSLHWICLKFNGFLRRKYSITFSIIFSGVPYIVRVDSESCWFFGIGNWLTTLPVRNDANSNAFIYLIYEGFSIQLSYKLLVYIVCMLWENSYGCIGNSSWENHYNSSFVISV